MQENLPEIVFSSSDEAESRRISRWVRSGRLRKLAPRVYTSNLTDSDGAIVGRNLYPILSKLFPGAVMSHRSALDGGPTGSGDIFLTYKYSRNVKLPGCRVHLLRGPGPTEDDMPFMGGLFMSSRPRAFLENLQIARARSSVAKKLPKAELEDRLEQICRAQGEESLNDLLDDARRTAESLGMEREFQELNKIVGSILRTRPTSNLDSDQTRARAVGAPYDAGRLELLNSLFAALVQSDLSIRKETSSLDEQISLLAFFDSYFSNYIEGTEFELSEARDIVFSNRIPAKRPQDAHDILGTFRIVANSQEMRRTPKSLEEFLDLLRGRHHTIMEARPEKMPGEFKQKPNRAGETHFVAPDLVRGTLAKGFEMCSAVERGLPRAIFMMFLVAETHPFADGNGRVARIMMNSELVSQGLVRIIIPTVYRDDYLVALRALSRSGRPEPIIRCLDFAQRFSAGIPLTSYEEATRFLIDCNAFREPDEARLQLVMERT